MSSEQQAQDPMRYRGVANPRRQRLSAAVPVRRTADGAADRQERPETGSAAVRPG